MHLRFLKAMKVLHFKPLRMRFCFRFARVDSEDKDIFQTVKDEILQFTKKSVNIKFFDLHIHPHDTQ